MNQLLLPSAEPASRPLNTLHLLAQNQGMLEHEIRTCISVINGFSSILQEVTHPEEKHHAYSIQQASTRLYQTLEYLLEFIRIESGNQQMTPNLHQIAPIARKALEKTSQRYTEMDLVLDYKESTPDLWAYIDWDRLQHILLLLLDNASRYAKAGTITLTLRGDTSHVEIQVSDTGPGIEADFLPHIFDPFTQQNRCAEGCGLGLALVKRMVEAMQGDLRVESVVGEGTTFTLTFPRVHRLPRTSYHAHVPERSLDA